ncbi:MAG: aminotransferase class IV, partial [Alphaproteobacteria bacterium]|nr:aminotransferase class IV [Alphaproteobacteria bacterium]
KIEANYRGVDEAIFFDIHGNVSEGSGDNIFVVKNGVIITPPTLNNLRGVTRLVVLELAASMGLTLLERNLGYFDLYAADEVFVTGTAAEVGPIREIDGRIIGNGKPGPITRQLMAAYKTATQKEGSPINR